MIVFFEELSMLLPMLRICFRICLLMDVSLLVYNKLSVK